MSEHFNNDIVVFKFGNMKVYRLNDPDTPYIVELVDPDGELWTATIACALDTGEVDGVSLTDSEHYALSNFEKTLGGDY